MSEDAVLLEIDGPLARITLNRPHALNAMNLQWVHGLEAAVERVAKATDVRLVLLRGAGRAFCAGLDLDMLGNERMPPDFYNAQERAFRGLEMLDAITVAALHGHCIGGGLQLAIACDIRVSTSDCHLGLPAVLEGLFPGMAPFRLPRLVGLGHARRLILSGEPIEPEEARRIGLVDYVLPPERFEAGLAEVLDIYLRAPRMAASASKRLMRRAFDTPFNQVFGESEPLIAACLDSEDVAAAAEVWRQRRAKRGSATAE